MLISCQKGYTSHMCCKLESIYSKDYQAAMDTSDFRAILDLYKIRARSGTMVATTR